MVTLEEAVLTIAVVEGEKRRVRISALEAAGVSLKELQARLNGFVRLLPSWRSGYARLEAGRIVGSQRVGHVRVDVRPRMGAAELATLIRYAWGRDFTRGRTDARVDREGLDELIGRLLADEARAIEQRGLAKRYEQRQEWLTVVRGRPDFAASFPWNERGMTSIVCRHHLLTSDNLNNRLMRAALERAVLLDVSVETRRSLAAHRAAWQSVAALIEPTGGDFAKVRQRYDRLSEHYELAHRLGELLVRGQRPSGLFESGVSSTGFTIDMASLFEAFVERALKAWAQRRGLEVRAQQPDKGAFLDAEGAVYRRVFPDIVLYRDRVPVAVLDAKYKEYWPAKSDTGKPSRRVSTADLYQLFFYSQRLQLKYDLPAPPTAFIVSPLPAADERKHNTIGSQYKHVAWRAGGEEAGEVGLLLLPLTRLLRDFRHMDWQEILDEALDALERRIYASS